MTLSRSPLIITVNGGSSSIKVSLTTDAETPTKLFAATLDRIGTENANFTIHATATCPVHAHALPHATFDEALAAIVDALKLRIASSPLSGIGHRIVHGGVSLLEHQLITPAVIASLKAARPLDLDHLPREIALIEGFAHAFQNTTQVACFDTAFHRDMRTVAQLLPIPRRFFRAGLRRFGFHGLSYTSLMHRLTSVAGKEEASGRVVLAHLGAGASMAAVHRGAPIDTTMSFTPLSGLVMATRPGDLDPGLVVYLLSTGACGDATLSPKDLAAGLNSLLSDECGMLGVSELSGDMRDLLACRDTNMQAAEAIDLFCYQARKHICALAGAMGGVDTIVFSGGIGENSPEVRGAICEGLEFLGVHLDREANPRNPGVISTPDSRVTVRVISTDEERVIVDVVRGVIGGMS